MSALTVILQLLFGIITYTLSFKGLLTIFTGVLLFLLLPFVSKITGEFKRLANFPLYLGASMLGRFAIVVTEHNEILLKRMQFDDLGVEKISFGDEAKEFEDPAARLHYWMDLPFAFADEVHGFLFDPRDAAIGQRKADAEANDEATIRATNSEWDSYEVYEWVKGVFAFPKNKHELVNLSMARQLVDGGERSEYPKRVEEIYKHSRAPFESGASSVRYVMILAALLGPFAMMWVMATQGSSGGGSTITGPGLLLLWGSTAGIAGRLSDVDWRYLAKVLVVALPLPIVFLLVMLVTNILYAFVVFCVLGMGFWLVPFLSVLLRSSKRLGGGLSRMLFKLGLAGYSQPVLEWTPAKYQLREYSSLDATSDVCWYGLHGSLFGVTFQPGEDSWGAEIESHDRIESRREAATDGGEMAGSNLPGDMSRAPDWRRGHSLAAYVPKRLKSSTYYVNSGIAYSRYNNSATGEKSLNRLLKAKEVHGGGGGLSDKAVLYSMLGAGAFSSIMGIVVFFL